MEDSTEHLAQLHNAPMRSRIEIMASIMNEIRKSFEGIRKTRLMYRCNLSFRQLKIYVRLLREKGFLRSTVLESEKVGANGNIGKVEVYHITEEGLSFLKAYNELRHRLREEFLPR